MALARMFERSEFRSHMESQVPVRSQTVREAVFLWFVSLDSKEMNTKKNDISLFLWGKPKSKIRGKSSPLKKR
jgi:hypothetical protein